MLLLLLRRRLLLRRALLLEEAVEAPCLLHRLLRRHLLVLRRLLVGAGKLPTRLVRPRLLRLHASVPALHHLLVIHGLLVPLLRIVLRLRVLLQLVLHCLGLRKLLGLPRLRLLVLDLIAVLLRLLPR